MTDWDQQWQDRITKVVRRVARDLIANDESEISEVVRRRLFEDLGNERLRKRVAKTYAEWCFGSKSERTCPRSGLAVDTAVTATETNARDFLRRSFRGVLSIPSRYALRIPAQVAGTRRNSSKRAAHSQCWRYGFPWAAREQFQQARTEPLITLGSAPLHVPEFRAAVLGQLGESRLDVAIDAQILPEQTARVKIIWTQMPRALFVTSIAVLGD